MALASLVALSVVAAINFGVRMAGGDVFLFSMARLSDRVRALGLLAVHAIGSGVEDADPKAALVEAAQRHGVSPRLVLSVARVESDYVHTSVSSTGAMGLMQLMPDTARELGVRDPFDIHQGADGGVRYLKQLLNAYRGDVRRALSAYNAGPGRVPMRGVVSLPPETRAYVGRILGKL